MSMTMEGVTAVSYCHAISEDAHALIDMRDDDDRARLNRQQERKLQLNLKPWLKEPPKT